ncbi:TrmB family transcriptional regulator [Halogeometricum limi]|uniref:Sugar-specific transcriptional regulator TrmB n=1 Tax=Halogeometricum limi TaxID=555875 RepID=A0A1I6IDH4_9EURY|nr:TrmB family transcriptional regulator sugar-binding domain-containing protein [Halogeometricum limi]SFR64758.1 Sugar-specific transcriptional regulator TrmB [Halogeometricum limi]
MSDDCLDEALRHAGLSQYESAVVVSLLDTGAVSVSDLARASGVPQGRVYGVVDGLEREGLVETFDATVRHVRLRDPPSLADRLRRRAGRLESACRSVERQYAGHRGRERDSHEASVLSDDESVLARARRAIREATTHVQLAGRPATLESLGDALEAAVSDGVHVEVSVHRTDAEASDELDESWFEGRCTEGRVRTLPGPFLLVADSEAVCLGGRAPGEYGLAVRDSAHAAVCYWYFLTCLWDGWESVHEAESGRPSAYREVRHFVDEVAPLRPGERIPVTVTGTETETGTPVRFSGEVVDTVVSGDTTGHGVARYNEQVALVVETAAERLLVGGRSAVLEDVRAERIDPETTAATRGVRRRAPGTSHGD